MVLRFSSGRIANEHEKPPKEKLKNSEVLSAEEDISVRRR
jgi:hypothetical protein